jgi:hypothetical protein
MARSDQLQEKHITAGTECQRPSEFSHAGSRARTNKAAFCRGLDGQAKMLDLILHEANKLVRKEWFAEQKSSIHQGEQVRIIFQNCSGNKKDRNGGIDSLDPSGNFQAIDRVGHHNIGQNQIDFRPSLFKHGKSLVATLSDEGSISDLVQNFSDVLQNERLVVDDENLQSAERRMSDHDCCLSFSAELG